MKESFADSARESSSVVGEHSGRRSEGKNEGQERMNSERYETFV